MENVQKKQYLYEDRPTAGLHPLKSAEKSPGVKKIIDINREVVLKAIDGDRASQSKLYHQYARAMFNICCRMMNGRTEAEDVLQEAFIDAFRRLSTFRFESTFGAWLKRVVVNHCINAIKAKKNHLNLQEDLLPFDREEENESIDEDDINYTVEKVKTAMHNLPKGNKLVLNLYLFEGYDHTEIAEILGISESTSKTQYMRAKNKIKEWLTADKRDVR